METIRISDKKLKIMLCPNDLWRYDLSVPIDITSSAGKTRLRRLLRDACGDGFRVGDGELLVQIYESAGGCELFVTRCEPSCGGVEMTNLSKPAAQKSKRSPSVYEFSDLSSLLSLCGILRERRCGTPSDSSAYADGSAYYLSTSDSCDIVAAEYGGVRLGELAGAYLAEHATCICRHDAVELLASLS